MDKIGEGINTYAVQFLWGQEISSRSTAMAWKPGIQEEICVVHRASMLMGIIKKSAPIHFFPHKRANFHTSFWRHCNTRERESETNL